MAPRHPLVRLETLALIAVGGFAGANLRYVAMGLFSDVGAVVLVNACGSFALGVLVYESQYTDLLSRESRLVFTTGFLSSLTTYSTFAIQTALAAGPRSLVAVVAANYGLGLAGVLVGRSLARRLAGGSGSAEGGEPA